MDEVAVAQKPCDFLTIKLIKGAEHRFDLKSSIPVLTFSTYLLHPSHSHLFVTKGRSLPCWPLFRYFMTRQDVFPHLQGRKDHRVGCRETR